MEIVTRLDRDVVTVEEQESQVSSAPSTNLVGGTARDTI
jgi:hypothetical protein